MYDIKTAAANVIGRRVEQEYMRHAELRSAAAHTYGYYVLNDGFPASKKAMQERIRQTDNYLAYLGQLHVAVGKISNGLFWAQQAEQHGEPERAYRFLVEPFAGQDLATQHASRLYADAIVEIQQLVLDNR